MEEVIATQARLQELRAEHRQVNADSHKCCVACGCEGDCLDTPAHWWPCEQSQILDLALEAERLRAAVDVATAIDAEYHALEAEVERLRAALRKAEARAEANQRDLYIIAGALDIGARPYSGHEAMALDILPRIRALMQEHPGIGLHDESCAVCVREAKEVRSALAGTEARARAEVPLLALEAEALRD